MSRQSTFAFVVWNVRVTIGVLAIVLCVPFLNVCALLCDFCGKMELNHSRIAEPSVAAYRGLCFEHKPKGKEIRA